VLIFRRWKVALPLLLFAIGATLYVAVTAKPDYTMTSYVQFIPAKVTATDDPAAASLRNPWNQLGLNTLGQASIYATQTQGFLDTLKATHHTNNFTLTMTYPNPIVTVEVVGTTQQDALDTTQVVIDRLRQSALTLQSGSGVGTGDLIATQRLDQGQNLVPSTSKVKRAIMAVAAAGLILTAGGTVGFDALMRRRARIRSKREEDDLDEGQAPPEPTAGGVAAAEAKEPAPAATGPGMPRGPGRRPLNVVPGNKPGQKPLPIVEGIPAESIEQTAIIIKRTPSVPKAAVPKQWRPTASGTYRSANAQDQVNGLNGNGDDRQPASPEKNGNADDSSDVRVVLQPKWVGGENGGKSK